jgi:hypothetical protein
MGDSCENTLAARIPKCWLGSGESSAKPPGCHPGRAVENLRQMALVGEPGFEGDQGQRPAGAPHQGFCPLDPPLHNIALGADTDSMLERPAEMVRAEADDPGKVRRGQAIVQMRLDIVSHALRLSRESPLDGVGANFGGSMKCPTGSGAPGREFGRSSRVKISQAPHRGGPSRHR